MRGKFIAVAAFAALLALTLCACGQQGASSGSASSSASSQAAPGKYATMADVFAAEGTDVSWACDETKLTYAFNDNGAYTRVVVEMPEGAYKELTDAHFSQAKFEELTGELPIVEEEVLAEEEAILEELDKLIGMKGSEIADEGYIVNNLTVNGDKTYCSATKYPLSYLIVFDGVVEDPKTENPADAVKDMVVFDATIQGVSMEALGV